MGINPQNLITADQVNSKLMELCRIQAGQECLFEIWPIMPGGQNYALQPWTVRPGGEKVTEIDEYKTSTWKDYVHLPSGSEDRTEAHFISEQGGKYTKLIEVGDRIKGTFVKFLRFNKSVNPNVSSPYRYLYSGLVMLRGPFTRYNSNTKQTKTFGNPDIAMTINIGALVRNLVNIFDGTPIDSKGEDISDHDGYSESDEGSEEGGEGSDEDIEEYVPGPPPYSAASLDENQGMGGHKHHRKHKSRKHKLYKSIRKSVDKILKLLKHMK